MKQFESVTYPRTLPESITAGYPDPVVSANVYATGKLDEVLVRAVADFRTNLDRQAPAHGSYLWFLRYRRGGEHLKLRIHGSAELAPLLRQQLEASIQRYFAALPKPESSLEAPNPHLEIPPLDPEDRCFEAYPDRSLLWTSYERSYISLGGGPLLEDDLFVTILTRFLAASTDLVLQQLKLDEDGSVPHRTRQNGLIKILISTLAGLGLSEERRLAYLHYHRDWLLRFSLLKVLDRADKAGQLLARFDRQILGMGAGTGPIERNLNRLWSAAGAGDLEPSILHSMVDYLEAYRHNVAYQTDPFTDEPAFTGIFKGLHGAANQLGLNMIDEAFTYQLLLRLRAPAKVVQEIQLMPN